jgi:hypothetical protein
MWRISIGPSLAQLVVFAQQAAFALRACQPQASSLHRSRAGLRDTGDVLAPKRNLIVPGWWLAWRLQLFIFCRYHSRGGMGEVVAASLIAIESTADFLWEKGVEEEPIEVGTPPPSNNHCHWTSMNTPTFSSLQHRRFRYEDYKLASSLARHWAFSYIRRSPLKCTLGSSPSLNQDINNCPLLFWRLP